MTIIINMSMQMMENCMREKVVNIKFWTRISFQFASNFSFFDKSWHTKRVIQAVNLENAFVSMKSKTFFLFWNHSRSFCKQIRFHLYIEGERAEKNLQEGIKNSIGIVNKKNQQNTECDKEVNDILRNKKQERK